MVNNFRITDVLDGLKDKKMNIEEAVIELRSMNNSYANMIAIRLEENKIAEALVLFDRSVKFERKINKIDTVSIHIPKSQIEGRITNSMLINGTSRSTAEALVLRRVNRLKKNNVLVTSSIEYGRNIIEDEG